MKAFSTFFWLLLAIIVLPSCMADLRTALIKEDGITTSNTQKGKALLEAAWAKHGFNQLDNYTTYSFTGTDTWKGLMGKMGKPWPSAKSTIEFKYAIRTFDSQAHFLDGKRANTVAGLQSWNYYEKPPDGELAFTDYNKRIDFGLSAYHYFFELLDRLKRAPIISYAGEKTFNDEEYDLVFATWEKPEPHMKHDQYILWINKETGLLDYAVYSLRDNFLKVPAYKAFYGSIKFSDYQKVNGILIPFRQTVFLNQPKKKEKKNIHELIVSEFSFDDFDLEELYPDKALKKLGDRKVVME